jgi:hypothetical protein
MKVNEGCTEFTMEGILEVEAKLKEWVAMDSKPTKTVMHVASFYVKKDLMKAFTGILPKEITIVALITPGYITKYITSIALKMYERFYCKDETIIKTFTAEDKALHWVRSM